MRRNLSIACLLAAWLLANGAVWDAVQAVAWVRMFHTYTQTMHTTEALQETFDGSKPCPLCNISQKAQDSARSQLPPDAALGGGQERVMFLSDNAPSVKIAGTRYSWPEPADQTGLTRTEAVPVTPPRV